MKKTKVLILCLICLCCLVRTNHIYHLASSIIIHSKIVIDGTKLIDVNEKKPIIDEDILHLLANYPDFRKSVLNAEVNIPLMNDFIPQGLVKIDDKLLITGYYETNENSKCYVIDNKGEVINEVELDTNSHVGAIAYDKVNDLIWIPDNMGILNAYNRSDFFLKDKVIAKYQYMGLSEELTDYKDINRKHIAYLYVDNDYLYFGNFYVNNNCIVKKYKIKSNGNLIDLKYVSSFNVPSRIQGITFVEKDNQKYMLLSRSYGRSNSSQLFIYIYDENILDYNGLEIKMMEYPPMLEQISIDKNYLYLLFESGATKYDNCMEKMKVIPIIGLNEVLSLN